MASNFDFLKVNTETAVLFSTVNEAENNYSQKDYEGVLIRVRKVAEKTATLFANYSDIELPSYSTFHEKLQKIKDNIKNKEIVDAFFEIKRYGNNSAHELNPKEATKENALKSLEQI